MSSRIDDLRMVDPVLTTIAQGYSNAAMVAEYLFPTVTVSKLKGKIPVFGKDAFISRDYHRAIRADSNRIPPSAIELVTFDTQERDVETAIDYIEEEESPDFVRYEQKITKELMDILLLSKEIEAAGYVQEPDNFDASLKSEILEADAFDNYSATSSPIDIIKDAMGSVRAKIARYPNTCIIGDTTYRALLEHPKLLDRVKYSGTAKLNTALLAELLDIQNVYVGMGIQTSDGATFTDVWQDNIILAYVDKNEKANRSEFNPSYGYTFQRESKPEIDTYYENGGKIKVIRNTDNYCIKVTASDAAFLLYNTNHS